MVLEEGERVGNEAYVCGLIFESVKFPNFEAKLTKSGKQADLMLMSPGYGIGHAAYWDMRLGEIR